MKHKFPSFFMCKDIKNWKAPNSPDEREAIPEGLSSTGRQRRQESWMQQLERIAITLSFLVKVLNSNSDIIEIFSDCQVILTLNGQEYVNQRNLPVQMLFSQYLKIHSITPAQHDFFLSSQESNISHGTPIQLEWLLSALSKQKSLKLLQTLASSKLSSWFEVASTTSTTFLCI